MKKLLLILLSTLLTFLLATAIASAAGSMKERVKTTEIATTIQVNAMPLDNFLDVLSQESGIQILATPEAADIKIDLHLTAPQTLEQVFEVLKQEYSLIYQINDKKNAIIVLKTPAYDNELAFPRGDAPGNKSYITRFAPMALAPERQNRPYNTEEYKRVTENSQQNTLTSPLSTFSIDVDTASYSNVRRFINTGMRPLSAVVRTEELLNYFKYAYQQPSGSEPFAVTTEVGDCPWQSSHKLALIGLQGKNIATETMLPSNLVFLIDVSGSMEAANKLPLIKTAFKMLVTQLRPQDTISIVVYAGSAGVVLEPTSGSEKEKIIQAIDSLHAGGSTAGGEGILLAYKIAKENYIKEGNNRVVLATDGDFNVGVSSEGELTRMIEERRNDGIFLSVLGFGMGNIKDNKMEALAGQGNGNYAYIDSAQEAKKIMVGQMAGTLYTIAKDVKLQVEFNPARVKSYRLIGYENRVLANSDFNNDQKDAGDMGAGHTVTALYEIIPVGSEEPAGITDPLIYQQPQIVSSDDLLQVKIRYKKPEEDTSILLTKTVGAAESAGTTSENFRFAAAVAEYALLLKNSEYKGQANYQQVLELAKGAKGSDEEGYRSEFVRMVEITQLLVQ
ncbi:MAG: von Willebrand factor [Firmicutes bacterium]|nr:von Willebrand factor [Bacillota bacterium]